MPTQSRENSDSPSSSSSRRSSWDRESELYEYNEKEIFMGALVSPRSAECEKRSIDVPCIILSTSLFLLLYPPPISNFVLKPLTLHGCFQTYVEMKS